MEKVSLTSRIVGAIVILSLGIIFIPLLLETNKIDSGSMKKSPIPEIPSEISTIVFQLNEETGKFEEQGAAATIEKFEQHVNKEIDNSANEIEPTELEQKEKTAPQKVVKKSQDKTQHSWMLQLASFKDRKKALKLRDQLREMKYVAHLNERKQDSGSIWRVRIGPSIKKSKIQEIQAILEKEMGMRGLIIRRR